MSKETVFLADSSYAIRKIAERNFTDDNNYTLLTFKSGQGLKEQILEQKPYVVLVELKLPEWNGYDVCRFINSEPSLENTHIFLLRAAFDPVEEEKLHGMNYVDIVTKPFDHAALLESIEKLGNTDSLSAETGVPDDIPEIDDFDVPSEDLSFSDIKDVIDSEAPSGMPDSIPMTAPRSFESFGDEVQPSEEITQGSIPSGRDPLSPPPPPDEIDNPFDDNALQEHIKEQESELGIGSITQEAMAIEASMASSRMDDLDESPAESGTDGDTSEATESRLDNIDPDEDFKDFSFDEPESMSFPEDIPDIPASEPDTPDFEKSGEENESYSVEDREDQDSYERPTPPSFLDIAATSPEEEAFDEEQPEIEKEESEVDDLPNWAAPPEQQDFSDFEIDSPEEALADAVDEIDAGETESVGESDEDSDDEVPFEPPVAIEEALPEEFDAEPAPGEEEEEPSRFDDFPGVEDPSDEESYNFSVSPEPDNTRTSESQAVSNFNMTEFPTPQEQPLEESMEEPLEENPEVQPTSDPHLADQSISLESLNSTDREIIMQRIEQNISQTLKDILWDIIPPIAERIIREEIESIKKELAQTID